MSNTLSFHDPQTVARLDSVACILEWNRTMSAVERKQLLTALLESNEDVHQVVQMQLGILKNPKSKPADRKRAIQKVESALFHNTSSKTPQHLVQTNRLPQPSHLQSQEALFSQKLMELMTSKCISQQELADRIGCSQPAISQMLHRKCRPHKQTLLQLAQALNVSPQELWPDLEVADMLDAVASFQEDNYTMTAAEARALTNTDKKNRPLMRTKSLPSRP